jgi:HEAT repeat protein
MPRKFLLSLTLVLGLTAACTKTDPNAFEPLVAAIKNTDTRDHAMSELTRLVKDIASAQNEERKREFAVKVIPAFSEIWDEAAPHRQVMLELTREMAQPEAAPIWQKALVLDGTADSRKQAALALQAIRAAHATASVDAVVDAFGKLLADPSKDNNGSEAGLIRREMASTLGDLGDPKARSVLVAALNVPDDKQPNAVHKAAAEALVIVGDASAVPALLSVGFRVKDAPGTQSIGERAKRAIAAIGDPAIGAVVEALDGKSEEINALAEKNSIPELAIKQSMVAILGAIGSPSATKALIAAMPQSDCVSADAGKKSKKKGKKKAAAAPTVSDQDVSLRNFIARSLGEIGDASAVAPLCACRDATHNPGDLREIAAALGRIGGDEAVSCLKVIAETGYYTDDAVQPEFVHEIRWEAAHHLLMASRPADLPKVKQTIASQKDANIVKHLKALDPAIKATETCKDDKACYLKLVSDVGADPIAREKAAFELSRAAIGDIEVATALARAFKVRSPEVRVTMAQLVPRVVGDKACPACIEALEAVMKSEQGNASPEMQLPWLTARLAIAKLSRR